MNPCNTSGIGPLKRLDGKPAFDEAWQAQVLAIVDSLISSGQISPREWSDTFGAALKATESPGNADTIKTYYSAALQALEQLLDRQGKVSIGEVQTRRSQWEQAYLHTPHGQPVTLPDG